MSNPYRTNGGGQVMRLVELHEAEARSDEQYFAPKPEAVGPGRPRAATGRKRVAAEREVPLQRALEANRGDTSWLLRGASGEVAGYSFPERCARLASICERLAEGSYRSNAVLAVVARKIVRSGELDGACCDRRPLG